MREARTPEELRGGGHSLGKRDRPIVAIHRAGSLPVKGAERLGSRANQVRRIVMAYSLTFADLVHAAPNRTDAGSPLYVVSTR